MAWHAFDDLPAIPDNDPMTYTLPAAHDQWWAHTDTEYSEVVLLQGCCYVECHCTETLHVLLTAFAKTIPAIAKADTVSAAARLVLENSGFKIVSITRVQNELGVRAQRAIMDVYNTRNTEVVYHGTATATAACISRDGFQTQFCRRPTHGVGVYTTTNIFEAIAYSPLARDGTQTVLQASLVPGHSIGLGSSGQQDFGRSESGPVITLTDESMRHRVAANGMQLRVAYRLSVQFDTSRRHNVLVEVAQFFCSKIHDSLSVHSWAGLGGGELLRTKYVEIPRQQPAAGDAAGDAAGGGWVRAPPECREPDEPECREPEILEPEPEILEPEGLMDWGAGPPGAGPPGAGPPGPLEPLVPAVPRPSAGRKHPAAPPGGFRTECLIGQCNECLRVTWMHSHRGLAVGVRVRFSTQFALIAALRGKTGVIRCICRREKKRMVVFVEPDELDQEMLASNHKFRFRSHHIPSTWVRACTHDVKVVGE